MAPGECVGWLSAQELLDDLPLELDRMRAVLQPWAFSSKARFNYAEFSAPPPVHPKGCTPHKVKSYPSKSGPGRNGGDL